MQHQNIKVMIVNFNEDYLRDLYRSGKSDKKHRFQPQIVRKYIRVIDLMISEDNVQGLWKYNSLNYERLEGNKEGLSSVRVNDQYRIEFEEELPDASLFWIDKCGHAAMMEHPEEFNQILFDWLQKKNL